MKMEKEIEGKFCEICGLAESKAGKKIECGVFNPRQHAHSWVSHTWRVFNPLDGDPYIVPEKLPLLGGHTAYGFFVCNRDPSATPLHCEDCSGNCNGQKQSAPRTDCPDCRSTERICILHPGDR